MRTELFSALGLCAVAVISNACTSSPSDSPTRTSRSALSSGDTVDLVLYTGYVDGDQSDVLLDPWWRSPNTVFIGTDPTCCTLTGKTGWDTGAVRVDNPSDGDVVIDSVVVDTGPSDAPPVDVGGGNFVAARVHWDIWPTGITIPAGQTLVLTMDDGFNFDASDVYGDYCLPQPTGYVPVVHVTVNGQTFDLTDDNQVLNTQGNDLGICFQNTTQAGAENHAWQGIGSVPYTAP
jgi:hypothetical protein